MSYFGDIMDNEDKQMNKDWDLEDEHKLFIKPHVKDLQIKVKSGGGDFSLAQGIDLVTTDKGLTAQKHKTEVNYKHCCEHDLQVTATNKDLTLQMTYAPHSLHSDDGTGCETTIEGEFKSIPKDGEFEGKLEMKVGGYELGPLKGWTELQVDVGNTECCDTVSNDFKGWRPQRADGNASTFQILTLSQSLNHGDFWFGAKAEVFRGKKDIYMHGGYAVLKYQSGDISAWMRASMMRKFLCAGMSYKISNKTKFSQEFNYDLLSTGKHTGLAGTPLFWRCGMEATHPNKTVFSTYLAAAGGSCLMTHKLAAPLSSTTKCTGTAQFDILKMFTDIKNVKSKIGFAVEYKV